PDHARRTWLDRPHPLMKGVILAGGLGTRLDPLTRVTNKHLLPVYNRPMIFYPLWTLINAGIEEILIVTGGNNAGDFLRLLGNGVLGVIEKPKRPPSRYAVTGIYFYDASVFDYVHALKPSRRGELEITDVNNRYIEAGLMTYEILRGWWTDAGTFESLARASRLVGRGGANKP